MFGRVACCNYRTSLIQKLCGSLHLPVKNLLNGWQKQERKNEASFDWRIENSHSSHGFRKATCLCVSVLKRRDPMIGRFVIIQWRVWCHEAGFAPTLDWKGKSDDGRRPFVTKA